MREVNKGGNKLKWRFPIFVLKKKLDFKAQDNGKYKQRKNAEIFQK